MSIVIASSRREWPFDAGPFFATAGSGDARLLESGRQDSNLRLRGPKPRALARLSYAPGEFILQCGEREDKGSGCEGDAARAGWYSWSGVSPAARTYRSSAALASAGVVTTTAA